MDNSEAQERALRNKTFGATSGGHYVAEAVKQGGKAIATSLDPEKVAKGTPVNLESKIGEQKFVMQGTVSGKDSIAVETVVKKDAIFGDKTLKLSEPIEITFDKDGLLSDKSEKLIQAVLVSEHTKGKVSVPTGIPFISKTITVTDITNNKAETKPEKRTSIDDKMQTAMAQVDSAIANGGLSAGGTSVPYAPKSTSTQTTRTA